MDGSIIQRVVGRFDVDPLRVAWFLRPRQSYAPQLVVLCFNLELFVIVGNEILPNRDLSIRIVEQGFRLPNVGLVDENLTADGVIAIGRLNEVVEILLPFQRSGREIPVILPGALFL